MEGLILGIGFIGLVIALLTPQSKLGVGITLASFAGYFALVGMTNWLPILLFFFGILMMLFELFIPDFGLAGVVGFLLLGSGLYLTHGSLSQTISDLALAIFLTGMMIIVLIKHGYSFNNFSRLVLQTNLSGEKGFSSVKGPSSSVKVGQRGKAATPLRPSGKAAFVETNESDKEDTVLLDVLSESGMIQKGVEIEIKKISGSKIIVRSVGLNE